MDSSCFGIGSAVAIAAACYYYYYYSHVPVVNSVTVRSSPEAVNYWRRNCRRIGVVGVEVEIEVAPVDGLELVFAGRHLEMFLDRTEVE